MFFLKSQAEKDKYCISLISRILKAGRLGGVGGGRKGGRGGGGRDSCGGVVRLIETK